MLSHFVLSRLIWMGQLRRRTVAFIFSECQEATYDRLCHTPLNIAVSMRIAERAKATFSRIA